MCRGKLSFALHTCYTSLTSCCCSRCSFNGQCRTQHKWIPVLHLHCKNWLVGSQPCRLTSLIDAWIWRVWSFLRDFFLCCLWVGIFLFVWLVGSLFCCYFQITSFQWKINWFCYLREDELWQQQGCYPSECFWGPELNSHYKALCYLKGSWASAIELVSRWELWRSANTVFMF